MTGQDAVNAAEQFKQRVDIDGVVLTKLDGDARGGAALSVRAVTGKPIKFASTGEKLDDFDSFHPDRMASRILGMGDVLTLIEKAQTDISREEAAAHGGAPAARRLHLRGLPRPAQAGAQDGLAVEHHRHAARRARHEGAEERPDRRRQIDRIEAIVFSMTPEERRHPDMIDGSRRQRIARGSGTQVADVNRLLKQFREMKKMLKQMARAKGGMLGAAPAGPERVRADAASRGPSAAGRAARCDIMLRPFGARGAPHVRLWEEVMSWPSV